MEKKHLINQIDVSFRDIQNVDYQFEVMKYILSCLSDKQLETTQKYIEVVKTMENKLNKVSAKKELKNYEYNR